MTVETALTVSLVMFFTTIALIVLAFFTWILKMAVEEWMEGERLTPILMCLLVWLLTLISAISILGTLTEEVK